MDFSLYSFIFILISVILFYLVRPKKLRIYVITLLSFFYVAELSLRAFVSLLATMLVTYAVAFLLHRLKKKEKARAARWVYLIGLIAVILSLFIHKYAYWLMCKMLGIEALTSTLESIIIPIGLSFYTFQIIDYLSDLYKGRIEFISNPVYLLCYLSYFPKFISGPLEKASDFMEQLRFLEDVRLFDNNRLNRAISCLLTGYFMKIVIADRAAAFVNPVFNDSWAYGSGLIILSSFIYTLQIYTDFAGYSLIAVGVSELFGIRLINNFNSPYMAESITDFWSRWHISLSAWIKEHLYIPLGGNRKGVKRQYFNLIAVFVICGIWHGAACKFIFWGLLHGVYSVVAKWAKAKNINWLIKGWSGRIITFLCVNFAWIFFGNVYFRGALQYLANIFINLTTTPFFGGYKLFAEKYTDFFVLVPVTIFLWIWEWISYKKKMCLADYITALPQVKRYILWYILLMAILILGVYGISIGNSDFIYMHF